MPGWCIVWDSTNSSTAIADAGVLLLPRVIGTIEDGQGIGRTEEA